MTVFHHSETIFTAHFLPFLLPFELSALAFGSLLTLFNPPICHY